MIDKPLVEPRRNTLLRVLASRGIAAPQPTRDRIEACNDTELLETWFDRALAATTLGDVFID
jgi:hypothetical protein